MILTIKDLIEKYPKIFVPYKGNPGYVNYSGVPDSWIPTIDMLCRLIQNRIDKTTRIKNPNFDPLDSNSKMYIDGKLDQVVCSQIKEKFGELRFYTFGNDDYVQGLIDFARELLWNTCENCGSNENIQTTKGWISRKCKKCIQDN